MPRIIVKTTGVNKVTKGFNEVNKSVDKGDVYTRTAKKMASDARKAKLKGWPTGRTRRAVSWEADDKGIQIIFKSVYAKSADAIKGVAKWILKYLKPRMKRYIKMIEKDIKEVYRKGSR